MDITAKAEAIHDGQPAKGALFWYDAKGNRYHVWAVKLSNGFWDIERTSISKDGILYRRDAGDERGHKVRRLSAGAKAYTKTIAYVLEQQNAHGIIEDAARETTHREAQAKAEADAGHAEFMRGALRRMADEITGGDGMADSTARMNLLGLAGGLTVAQLNRLSALVHGVTA